MRRLARVLPLAAAALIAACGVTGTDSSPSTSSPTTSPAPAGSSASGAWQPVALAPDKLPDLCRRVSDSGTLPGRMVSTPSPVPELDDVWAAHCAYETDGVADVQVAVTMSGDTDFLDGNTRFAAVGLGLVDSPSPLGDPGWAGVSPETGLAGVSLQRGTASVAVRAERPAYTQEELTTVAEAVFAALA